MELISTDWITGKLIVFAFALERVSVTTAAYPRNGRNGHARGLTILRSFKKGCDRLAETGKESPQSEAPLIEIGCSFYWALLISLDPEAGLEPASQRSERCILPLDDPGMATVPSHWVVMAGLVRLGPAIHVLLAATRLERRGCPRARSRASVARPQVCLRASIARRRRA